MLKNKSIDYIFGMITGIAIMVTFWACTQNPLNAESNSSASAKYQLSAGTSYLWMVNQETGQLYRQSQSSGSWTAVCSPM